MHSNLVQGGDGAGHGNLLALLVHSADVLEQTSEHDGLGRLLVPVGERIFIASKAKQANSLSPKMCKDVDLRELMIVNGLVLSSPAKGSPAWSTRS